MKSHQLWYQQSTVMRKTLFLQLLFFCSVSNDVFIVKTKDGKSRKVRMRKGGEDYHDNKIRYFWNLETFHYLFSYY